MPTIHVNPDPCIACTTCTVFCPVAQATGEFLGPRMIGPALQRFRLLNMAEDNSLSYCSNCKNCDISCPQGVQVGAINMAARAESLATEHPHFLRDWIVSHSETLAHLISPVPAPLKNYAMRNCLVRGVLDAIGIDKRSIMPSYAPKRFRQLLAAMKQKSGLTKKVAIFPGCYIDLYDPMVGEDLVWALNQAGYEVVSSDKFCCCGVPMVASGFMKDARRNAERNLSVLKDFAEQGIPVLTACPSCELMFKEEIPTFFPELAKGTHPLQDAQEFLLQAVQNGELTLRTPESQKKLLYHAPCHLRALGIGLPGYTLMRSLGLDISPANAGCCGISGSYGFKKEKHDISMRVGAELFEAVRRSQAGIVATECGTCRLQIQGATGVECLHPVSVIRRFCEEK